ncbi:hypothetical protein KDL01_40580 [Actinospica durhamensis]|uniref:Uncharacterized protein n=1 Tax=Actinospica durhamensis TaxID=1508375 RepID=A0A941F0T8_9ACTN|nr:hypothetical protein [Actinospica durhamensis]MBR7839619.1 hypothetical protein [Actinospica durhamensis]
MSGDPAEHARFHGYVRALSQVADVDECDLVRTVLADPDHVMAQSAVIRHIDRTAERLGSDGGYLRWRERIAPVVQGDQGDELLRRRLQEWTLFKAILGENAWSGADLVDASNWLQLKVAERALTPRALATLAERGRTNRIRTTARARLNQPPG